MAHLLPLGVHVEIRLENCPRRTSYPHFARAGEVVGLWISVKKKKRIIPVVDNNRINEILIREINGCLSMIKHFTRGKICFFGIVLKRSSLNL